MSFENPIFMEIEEDFKTLGYKFRLNELDDSLEVYFEGKWCKYDDTLRPIIRINMRSLGYGGKKKPAMSTMEEGFQLAGYYNRYHVIKEYLNKQVEKYTPKHQNGTPYPYLIRGLQKYVNNQDGMFSTWLFKWMVGAIAKVFDGERNPMLVLAGSQHIGKSSFAEWLCPLPDNFIRGGILADNKDHKMRLCTGFIWEVDELGATTRRQDVEAFKSFITLNKVYERKAYGYNAKSKQANCSFIGTANPDGAGFLNDPTGSTRFLICHIDNFDFNYSEVYNPHDLWSEAMYFYKNVPNSWKLTDQQAKKRNHINARYEVQSALEDVLLELFEINPSIDNFMTTKQIKAYCYGEYRITNEQAFFNELSRVLTKLGLEKSRTGNRRGWRGIRYEDKT